MSGALYVPFDDLIEIIGEIPTIKLVGAVGGTHLYVPVRFRPESETVRAIGRSAADMLSRHFSSGRGGMWIRLPRGPASARAEMRRRLEEMAMRSDLSLTQIARELRVTERGVQKARRRVRGKNDDCQGRLF